RRPGRQRAGGLVGEVAPPRVTGQDGRAGSRAHPRRAVPTGVWTCDEPRSGAGKCTRKGEGLARLRPSPCVPSMGNGPEVKVLPELGRRDRSEPQGADREGSAERSGVANPSSRRTETG